MPVDRIWVWCEDHTQEVFARRLLERFGIDRRRVHFDLAPGGTGAASQWVTLQAPSVIKKARSARNQVGLGFAVIVDGDNVGLVGRMRALFGRPDSRDDDDRIAAWIPTWSIETWILWLCKQTVDGAEVDESRSYKECSDLRDTKSKSEFIKKAAAAWSSPRSDESARLPSLAAARQEMCRLGFS